MRESSDATRTVKRRGILAAAGAVVAGIAAKQVAQETPVAADGATWTMPYDSGTQNTASTLLTLTNTGTGDGLDATSSGGHGVVGTTNAANGSGMAGVLGVSKGPGTYGVVGAGSTPTSNQSGVGVYGTSTFNIGVYGASVNGSGVVGVTQGPFNYGVLGTTYGESSTAIAGTCTGNASSAFSGGTTNGLAYAALFQGKVVVQGPLIVTDLSYKSGALAHPDGGHRLVYCVESPESWIEDVGTGTLTGGMATVNFDKDFTAVTHTDSYHVFLTPYDGACKGLGVAARHPEGFTVQELNGGASNGTFSWKVMVKAKSTVKQERLVQLGGNTFAL